MHNILNKRLYLILFSVKEDVSVIQSNKKVDILNEIY